MAPTGVQCSPWLGSPLEGCNLIADLTSSTVMGTAASAWRGCGNRRWADARGLAARLLAAAASLLLLSASCADAHRDEIALDQALQAGDQQRARALIAAGADVNWNRYWPPLTWPILQGDAAMARLLIDSGAMVDMPLPTSHESVPPIDLAAIQHQSGVLRVLLEAGADTGMRDEDGRDALSRAVAYGRGDAVRILIEAGADLESKDKWGWTPVHIAAFGDLAEVAAILVKAGAKLEALDADGLTPLMLAAKYGRPKATAVLLNAGAKVNAVSPDGSTPLHICAIELWPDVRWEVSDEQERHDFCAVAELLLAAGAKVNARDAAGRTALHVACDQGEPAVPSAPSYVGIMRPPSAPDLVRLLLKHGAKVNAADAEGLTPLHMAARRGHPDLAKVLLDAGANADAKDKNGFTPLLVVAGRGYCLTGQGIIAFTDVVRVLVEAGADVNCRDRYGSTPLHRACVQDPPEVVRLLLEAGADPRAVDGEGKTPGQIAAFRLHGSEYLALLDQYGG